MRTFSSRMFCHITSHITTTPRTTTKHQYTLHAHTHAHIHTKVIVIYIMPQHEYHIMSHYTTPHYTIHTRMHAYNIIMHHANIHIHARCIMLQYHSNNNHTLCQKGITVKQWQWTEGGGRHRNARGENTEAMRGGSPRCQILISSSAGSSPCSSRSGKCACHCILVTSVLQMTQKQRS